jgi:hypothetical protein
MEARGLSQNAHPHPCPPTPNPLSRSHALLPSPPAPTAPLTGSCATLPACVPPSPGASDAPLTSEANAASSWSSSAQAKPSGTGHRHWTSPSPPEYPRPHHAPPPDITVCLGLHRPDTLPPQHHRRCYLNAAASSLTPDSVEMSS